MGSSCDLWVDPPGQRWEDYVHTTDERVMVVEGEVEFEIAGVRQRPPPVSSRGVFWLRH